MRCLVLLGCCTAGLAAQQVVTTAHPQETLQNRNGNLSALGVFTSGQAAEARAQILLRQLELPGPGATLVGIEVHTQTNSMLVYSALTIRAAATTATQLLPQFDANLQNPVTVLQATNLLVNYSTTAWTTIQLPTPYVHDGQSALVLDIAKVVSPNTVVQTIMDTPSPPARTDRPQMMHSFGNLGSGASSAVLATTTSDPLCLRLLWTGVPTMRHRSDPGGPLGNHYSLGSFVTYTVEGEPGAFYISALAPASLATPIPLPGAVGLLHIIAPFDHIGFLDANGVAVHTVLIPAQTVFLGLRATYQAGVQRQTDGLGQLTNAHDHFVNP